MSFLDDENATGFRVCISFNNGKTSVNVQSRLTAGEPLEIASNDDISDEQLYAICNVLDELP